MSPRLALTDQELLDYSGYHVLYELQMFALVAKDIPSKTATHELSAFIESFAIHLRNLIDFFYDNDPRKDDVIAADFFDNPTAWNVQISPTLEAARERANKEVSHLTLQRKDPIDPDKPWPIDVYFKEVRAVAQAFIAGASQKKLDPKVTQWVNLCYGQRIFGVGGVQSVSNSTTGTI